jgi:hopene-associated glycosyltransferase HpnB
VPILETLVAAGGASLLAWAGILAHPARPWDLRPIAEDEPPPPEPARWPTVRVLVPARNEAALLPLTLPALAAQDYPGDWGIVVVDDRSSDGTAAVARSLAGDRVTVVDGAPLPEGWAGKVWALEQALERSGPADYLLLTDADIRHVPGSLRRLVAESEASGLALDSRMARLAASALPERLLLPPFLFFFNLLYPMRLVNDPSQRTAAAAGGCVLVRRHALERAGGFAAIRGEVIDDVNLARRVKASGGRLRLAVSRADVVSLRRYESVGSVWRMVRRTAFDELRYSWLRLLGTVAGLCLLFLVPPALLVLAGAWTGAAPGWRASLAGLGVAAWVALAAAFLPAVRYFGLRRAWALTLPLGGTLYGGMTVDSAVRHALGRDGW